MGVIDRACVPAERRLVITFAVARGSRLERFLDFVVSPFDVLGLARISSQPERDTLPNKASSG